ncbi:hypothetical protein ACE04B_21370, partial [Rhizobium phaseoli]
MLHAKDRLNDFAALGISHRLVDLVEVIELNQFVEREKSLLPILDQLRDELGRNALSFDNADQCAAEKEVPDIDRAFSAESGRANETACSRRTKAVDCLTENSRRTRAFQAEINAC